MKNIIIQSLMAVVTLVIIIEATQREKRVYNTVYLSHLSPVVDGVLNDSVWLDTSGWQGDFLELLPHEGKIPYFPTRFKIVYNEKNIFLAMKCYDDPKKIRKVFGARDQKVGDMCGVAFDSYFNKVTAYEFDLTAAGQKVDVMYLPGVHNYDWNWNAIWDGATTVTDSGWNAEFRIPLSQLRYTNKEEQIWGLHLWRLIERDNNTSQWNLIFSSASPGAHNFGLLKGLNKIRSSRQIQLLPYSSIKYDYNDQNANPYKKNYTFTPDAGLNLKIGLTSNFTLDATVNPDFGQVEADPSELNLTAYETYFDEKRPFFLEGTDIFDFNIGNDQPFYSRRIGDRPHMYPHKLPNEYNEHADITRILASGKLTGRTKQNLSIGILETVTNSEYDKLYSLDTITENSGDTVNTRKALSEPLTNYFSSRFKRESKNANTMIGGTINSVGRRLHGSQMRNEMVSNANSAGIDFLHMFCDKKYRLSAKAIGSYCAGTSTAITNMKMSSLHRYQRPDAEHIDLDTSETELSGVGGYIGLRKANGLLQFSVSSSFRTPGLDLNDEGYMREADIIDEEAWVGVLRYEPIGIFREIQGFVGLNNRWTFGGEQIHSDVFGEFWVRLDNLWVIYIQGQHNFPYLDTRVLRGGPALYTDYLNKLYIDIVSDVSKKINFEIEDSFKCNTANSSCSNWVSVNVNIVPIDQLKLSLMGTFEENNLPYEYIGTYYPDSDALYLVGHLNQRTASITLRTEYFITPEISFQYYGSPYFSALDYSEFQRVNDSRRSSIIQRFHTYSNNEISFNSANNTFSVNEQQKTYQFINPDCSFSEFRSNFVFRWEYRPGSTLYLVWTHNQGDVSSIETPSLKETGIDLFKTRSRDIFMAKLSYWFNI